MHAFRPALVPLIVGASLFQLCCGHRCGPVDFKVIQTEENKPRNILEEIVWYAACASAIHTLLRKSLIDNTSPCQAQGGGNRKDEGKAAHSKALNDAEAGTHQPRLYWSTQDGTSQNRQAWPDS